MLLLLLLPLLLLLLLRRVLARWPSALPAVARCHAVPATAELCAHSP